MNWHIPHQKRMKEKCVLLRRQAWWFAISGKDIPIFQNMKFRFSRKIFGSCALLPASLEWVARTAHEWETFCVISKKPVVPLLKLRSSCCLLLACLNQQSCICNWSPSLRTPVSERINKRETSWLANVKYGTLFKKVWSRRSTKENDPQCKDYSLFLRKKCLRSWWEKIVKNCKCNAAAHFWETDDQM